MSIHVINDCIFTLHTVHTTYQFEADALGIVRHLYYGSRVENTVFSYLVQTRARAFSGNPPDASDDRTISLDTLPLEYPAAGCGDYRESCIMARHENGSCSLDLRYYGYRILNKKPVLQGLPSSLESDDTQTLEIALFDQVSQLYVYLIYSVFEAQDVIARSVRVENCGEKAIHLERVLSCCLDLFQPEARDLITLYGRHMGECSVERRLLPHGKSRVESTRGASSLHYNPSAILCTHDATETAGSAYAAVLVYSGSFLMQAELDQIAQTRLVAGIQPEGFSWKIDAGECFTAPEVLLSYSGAGLGSLSQQLHCFINRHIIHGKWAGVRRPVLLNSWEAAYCDFDDQKILSIAASAARLGIELFVLDDGWFGKRNSDTSSLGDWYVNEDKIKCGLPALCEEINRLGLRFGIWIEPEMISLDSDLYRAHADWMLAAPNRAPVSSRCQYVLDMSREDVVDYLYDCFHALFSSCSISYVKWDMNRSISDFWSAALPAERQGELAHRYMLGVYRLLERLTDAFPDILLETCSSGGGRFDAGMLYYSPQIWCSDNTDPLARLSIQSGTEMIYPPSCIGAHVSASPNHQTGRRTELFLRGAVAMTGAFGYELDPSKLSAEEQHEIADQIKEYQKNWSLYSYGTLYRLESGGTSAWMQVSEDKRCAVVTYVERNAEANAPVRYLRLRGLCAERIYRVEPFGYVLSGSALMQAGLPLPELLGNEPVGKLILEGNTDYD